MTDDELKELIASNARSCEANSSAIADLGRGMVQFREESAAFRNELRSWVQLHNQISDDQGAEVADLRTSSNLHDAQVTALRDAANADRQAFVEQAEADRAAATARADADRAAAIARADADRAAAIATADADRQEFRDALAADRTRADEDRTTSDQRFEAQLEEIRAQGQQIRALLSALANTNGRVDNLEQAS